MLLNLMSTTLVLVLWVMGGVAFFALVRADARAEEACAKDCEAQAEWHRHEMRRFQALVAKQQGPKQNESCLQASHHGQQAQFWEERARQWRAGEM